MKKLITTIASLFITTVVLSQTYVSSLKSGEWSDVSVWSNGQVPDANTSLSITGGHSIHIDVPIADVLDISQDSNTVIRANQNGTLNVAGYWRTQGQFVNNGNSVVRFNGVSDQAIVTADYVDLVFSTIVIDNPTTINLYSNVKLLNELQFVQGIVKTYGNSLILISDSNNTARIGVIPPGSDFDGEITMERYIKSNTTGWKFFGPAVSGAYAKDLSDDIATFGYKGSAVESYSFSSIQYYDEMLNGILDSGFVGITDCIDGFVSKRGYKIWTDSGSYNLDLKGTPLKFNQNFNVTYTDHSLPSEDGWNLITNPYPSSICWNSPSWTKTNIENAIYVWNADMQQFSAYVNGISINGGSNIIPSSQSFFVKANDMNPALACDENIKTANYGAFNRTYMPINQNIKLVLNNSTYYDETIINFSAAATLKYNGKEDALKLKSLNSNAPNMGTVVEDLNLSVNTIPSDQNDLDVPVSVKVGVSGNYTIKPSINMPTFNYTGIILEDLLTGIKTDLKSGASYNFTISDTTKAPRFVLHLTNLVSPPVVTTTITTTTATLSGIDSNEESSLKKATDQTLNSPVNKIKFTIFPNPNNGEFTIDISGLENDHEVTLYLRDEKGAVVYNSYFNTQDESSIQRRINPDAKLNNGIYFCTIVSQGIEQTVKVIVN